MGENWLPSCVPVVETKFQCLLIRLGLKLLADISQALLNSETEIKVSILIRPQERQKWNCCSIAHRDKKFVFYTQRLGHLWSPHRLPLNKQHKKFPCE
jgi:hypothetical protein